MGEKENNTKDLRPLVSLTAICSLVEKEVYLVKDYFPAKRIFSSEFHGCGTCADRGGEVFCRYSQDRSDPNNLPPGQVICRPYSLLKLEALRVTIPSGKNYHQLTDDQGNPLIINPLQ